MCSVEEYCRTVDQAEFQQIYHLASVVGPAGVLPHAGRIVQSVVNDTYRLVELALRWQAKLVDVSTSEVYGGGQNGFCTEDYPKLVPAKVTVRLEYAVAKMASETAILNTCLVSPLKASIVRPFNIAGPRQSGKGGFVLPRFIAQSLRNEPLTVFGTGQQVRAFTHVKDMADGLIRAMERGGNGEVYNLGNPENRITVLELARRVIQLTGSKSEIAFVDPRDIYGPLYTEASDKYPDATRARRDLGWCPKYGTDWVILDAVEAYRAKESTPR
jgi:UDP-glucose 4-epimerase